MKTIITTVLMMSFSLQSYHLIAATVQDSTDASPFSISGAVDVYYRVNLNSDFDQAPGTSFANLPGFSLGMANLVLAHEGKKVGVTADLVFGPRGEDATFLSNELRPGGISNIVNQLYAYWNITKNIKATIGNFNTFLGYEVISPTGNFNYSTSYMFSYGPFSHTGLKFDFDLGDGFSIMTGIFNPTDATEYNPTNDFAGGVQLGYNQNGLGVWVNTLISEDFYQVDLTAGYDVSETLYIGLNATTAKDAFHGVAAYAQVATSESLKLGARVEYFQDKGVDTEMVGVDNDVIDITASAQYTVGNLTIIPEFRVDLFSDSKIISGDTTNSELASFVLAAVYAF